MTIEPVGVGVVGCGDIAPVYVRSLRRMPQVRCVRLADAVPGRAAALGAQEGVPTSPTLDRLLADDDVELVLNLTPPQAHTEVTLRAVRAGRHVYTEKPLAPTTAAASHLLDAARAHGVRLGCAPASWLGGTWQTCRELVDAGVLGRPVGADLVFLDRGYESWHPDPENYHGPAAGPLLDMGPYYVAAMVFLFGAVERVCGLTRTTIAEREVGAGPRRGTRFRPGAYDHVAGTFQHVNGVIATLTTSFASWPGAAAPVQLFGSEATLALPPANHLGGRIWVRGVRDPDWRPVPLRHGRTGQRRWWAVGVADFADALRAGTTPRASGELGLHVLDVLEGMLSSSRDGATHRPATRCPRPRPLPALPRAGAVV